MGENGKQHDGPVDGRHLKGTPSKDSGPFRQVMLFARNFIKHPNLVGWVLPSSRFLVNEVLKQIDWGKARIIVEYGPGVGAFTTRLLERMRPDATLIAIEINSEFSQHLRSSIRDPRLQLVNGSATEVCSILERFGHAQADYIVSGIPFKSIPHPMRDEIVRETYSALSPKGTFLVYQFSGAVLPYLERVFGRVSQGFELRNILPARLFFCGR